MSKIHKQVKQNDKSTTMFDEGEAKQQLEKIPAAIKALAQCSSKGSFARSLLNVQQNQKTKEKEENKAIFFGNHKKGRRKAYMVLERASTALPTKENFLSACQLLNLNTLLWRRVAVRKCLSLVVTGANLHLVYFILRFHYMLPSFHPIHKYSVTGEW